MLKQQANFNKTVVNLLKLSKGEKMSAYIDYIEFSLTGSISLPYFESYKIGKIFSKYLI